MSPQRAGSSQFDMSNQNAPALGAIRAAIADRILVSETN